MGEEFKNFAIPAHLRYVGKMPDNARNFHVLTKPVGPIPTSSFGTSSTIAVQ